MEARWGSQIPDEHAILTWMVEHAAVVLNKCEVVQDGKTLHERLKGKKAFVLTLEFGKNVHFRHKPAGGILAKLSVLWHDGVYLGQRGASGECTIGTPSGIELTGNVHRTPEDVRWNDDIIKILVCVPWRKSKDDPEQDCLVPLTPFMPPMVEQQPISETVVPRRVYIKREDVEKFGFTPKCPGCKAILQKKPPQTHSEACRLRFEVHLEGHRAI